ncbi:hypothetical protein LEN26_015236 [Aphanomyces euteiches]|nr:hypothetical protein AeMF1_021823 [Aphanomyces euteiches]KAH9103598.1 hypothetical protein AeMF1_020054 [Aphanomyces euteiches]KAH9103672.1 hypothetical protein LEN26_015236 [Aphanomyces euteiches]KAH9119747.1 hypothetical protein AeMF1_007760 [Aphanomyces euteiches]KAH9122311.1 hypothetical protein AeMF1_006310 [Aphanomyces euteiches]
MDLRITTYGTDAKEYTLVSKGSNAQGYTILLAMLSLLMNVALLSVVFILVSPIVQPYLSKTGTMAWLSLPKPHSVQSVLWIALPVFAICFFLKSSFGSSVIEESVLVIPQIGVQLRKKQQNGHEKFMFLEATSIKAVVINEAITFSDVIYYLAFIVQDESKMILAFEAFRPRVIALQKIYRGTKQLLFPDDSKMSML